MEQAAATPPGTTSTDDDGARTPRAPSLASVLIVLAAALPGVVAGVGLIGRGWMPSFDQALEVLRVADVGGPHSPLVGVFSRWGWAHPGPLLFYVLAPFELALGATGVLVGTAAINAASSATAAIGAMRAGGPRLGIVVAGALALLSVGLGVDGLVDPWNPTVALLPWTASIVLVWAATLDRPWLLVPAVALASFALQAHVGYFLLVAAPLAAGSAAVAWQGWRKGRVRSVAAAMGAAAATGLACWAAPLWQQVTGDPGNLGAIAAYARAPATETAGLGVALGSLGAHVRLLGPWLTGDDANGLNLGVTGAVAPAIVLLGAIVVVAVAARRRGRPGGPGSLAALVVILVVLGIVTSARVTGLYAPYIVLFWRGIGALAVLALAWGLVVVLPGWRRSTEAAVAATLVVVLGAAMVVQLPTSVPLPEISRSLARLVPQVEEALVRDHTYLVRGHELRHLGAPMSGLFVALERRGYDVRVDPDPLSPLTYGTWRTAEIHEADGVLFVVDQTSISLGWEPPEGAVLLASHDPLTPDERRELERLEARVRAEADPDPAQPLFVHVPYFRDLLVRGGARRTDVERLAVLHGVGDRYEVHLLPSR